MLQPQQRGSSEGASSERGSKQSTTTFACNKCKQTFSTRNKLFEHIKTSGHALHVDSSAADLLTTATSAGAGKTAGKGSARKAKEKKSKKKYEQ